VKQDKITGKTYDSKLLTRLAKYMQPYKRIFWTSVVLTILLAAVAPALPMLIEYTLDRYILANEYSGLDTMLIFMLALLLAQTIIRYFHTLMTNTLGQSVIRDIRIQVFNHITNLRLKYFDNTPIGRLITRTISDLETIANIFSEGLIQIIGDLLQLCHPRRHVLHRLETDFNYPGSYAIDDMVNLYLQGSHEIGVSGCTTLGVQPEYFPSRTYFRHGGHSIFCT
jgi:ABC-type bacteriocin/lantibiotic exporter with double-glycine peptidase domain